LVEARRAELWDLLASGTLRPRHVDFSLDDITQAIDLVTTRSVLRTAAPTPATV